MSKRELTVKDHLKQMTSPDYFEREEAIRQLGRMGGDEAVAGLVMALEDENRGIRELAAEYLIDCGGELCTRLLANFLSHEDISVRNLASEVLVSIGPKAVPALIDALTDPQQEVRKTALDALGLIGDSSAADRIHSLLDDTSAAVACSAAEALGYFGLPQSGPHLLRAFEMYPYLRPQAAEALGRIGDPVAFSGLSKYLDLDDSVVLYSVIDALGRLGHPDGVELLQPMLNHPDQMISNAAAAGIIRTMLSTDRESYRELPEKRLRKFLMGSLSSGDLRMVQFAIGALYQWDSTDIGEDLVAYLKQAPEALINPIADVIKAYGDNGLELLSNAYRGAVGTEISRLLAATARIADPILVPTVARLASADDDKLRAAVAYTLGRCGNHTAIDTLARLAVDSFGLVRAAALRAIGWIGSEREVELLVNALDDTVEEVRQAAKGALILVGGQKAIEIFCEDLNHIAPKRQKLAALALGMIGEDAAREPLRRAVTHSNAEVRRAAVDALCRIGCNEDLDTIRTALNDEDIMVRKAAISGLADTIGIKAVNDIKTLLSEDDVYIKCHVIDTIGILGDAQYADLIAPYLKDTRDIVKLSVVKALAAMGAQDFQKQLKKIQTDRDSDPSMAVEDAAN